MPSASVLLLSIVLVAMPAAAKSRVELIIVMDARAQQAGVAQKWLKVLTGLGVESLGVQIRSAAGGEQPEITNTGTEARPHYRVLGVLVSADKLLLKGGKFTSRDAGRLKRFLETLQADGIAGATEPKTAFGLTAKQYEALHIDLARPVTFSTRGVGSGEVVKRMCKPLGVQVELNRNAAALLDRAAAVDEEFKDVATGTALTALLRPQGLALVPFRRQGNQPRLAIKAAAKGEDGWPIGHTASKKERDLVPVLFEFLNVEIDRIPLNKTLSAVQPRLKIPFLFDGKAVAREKIDLKQPVSVPAGRSYYRKILDRVLFQAKLKGELRVDDAGKPFLWITSLRPAPS